MEFLGFELDILTIIVFVPLIGAAVVGLMPKGNANLARGIGLLFSLSVLVPSIVVFVEAMRADLGPNEYVYQKQVEWFGLLGSSWHVGVDGLSAPMVLLTALLTPLAIIIAFEHTERPALIVALFLLLQTTMFGVFVSLDMLLFFLFYELGLVPMYFIIYLWGGENRIAAARKFFLVTMAMGLGMLLSIQLVAVAVGGETGVGITFDIPTWHQVWPTLGLDGTILGVNGAVVRWLTLLGFFLAFAVKIPVWPFHTWLPDAHTEAPTAGSMILAGVLLKLGAFGFLRLVIPLFPLEWVETRVPSLFGAVELPFLSFQFVQVFALLATVSIVFGAFSAWGQDDFKKLVAYSSVNHMGFVAMGLAVFAAVYGAGFALEQPNRADLVLTSLNQRLSDQDVEDLWPTEARITDLSVSERNQLGLLKLQALKTDEARGFTDITFTCGEVTTQNVTSCAIESFPRIEADSHNATVALNGAVMQMFNHGLSAAGMFLLVGALYHKAHTRDLRRFGGLWHTIPVYGAVLVFMSMASLGLPGLNGFIGEYLVIAGSFPVQGFEWFVLVSMIGLLITGAYILKGLQKVLHGPVNPEWEHYHRHHHSLNLNLREGLVLVPLMALILLTGIYPNWILPVINDSVSAMLAFIGG